MSKHVKRLGVNNSNKKYDRKRGYNYFTTPIGQESEMTCNVCGSICDVYRNQYGATSFAGAMAGKKSEYDAFDCPHSDEDWHNQTLLMIEEFEKTHSPSLKKIIQKDIDKIKKENL